MKKLLAFLVFFFLAISNLQATPLRMDYTVQDLGSSLYRYDFSLILDNNDDSWNSGEGWGGVVFGDHVTSSPLTNFVGDTSSLPAGPWTSFGLCSGSHNGYILLEMDAYWNPAAYGETITWSGSSTADLAQGELLFSTVDHIHDPVTADFEVANRVASSPNDPVPEPATMLLFGSGLAGLAAFRRKIKN